uniref:Uncharacterized protein n=1 Tax=Magallana gigas TaxID=29159 RepID=A0A8W8LLN3_MAGGI
MKADEISRNRPETNVKPIQNTRKLHNIENTTEPYLIKSKKITLLKMKQDANKGKETVTNENREATKEHIETMLTKAKLLMQRNLSNQEIRRGPLEDVKEGNEKQINVCKDSKGASEAYLSIMACQSYEDLEIVADQLQLSPISEKTPDVTITTHKRTVDKASMSLVPNDDGLENLFPCLIYGDGKCLPRCGSLFAYGTENKHLDIR